MSKWEQKLIDQINESFHRQSIAIDLLARKVLSVKEYESWFEEIEEKLKEERERPPDDINLGDIQEKLKAFATTAEPEPKQRKAPEGFIFKRASVGGALVISVIRCPKKGEWYLADGEALQADFDFTETTAYILEKIDDSKETTEEGDGDNS